MTIIEVVVRAWASVFVASLEAGESSEEPEKTPKMENHIFLESVCLWKSKVITMESKLTLLDQLMAKKQTRAHTHTHTG